MAKNYELIGRDVLIVNRMNPYKEAGIRRTALRLSSVVSWEVDLSKPDRAEECTYIELTNGTILRDIIIPFDEFTKIIALPLAASLGLNDE